MRNKKSRFISRSCKEIMAACIGFSISEYLGFTDEEIAEMALKEGVKIPSDKTKSSMEGNYELKNLEKYNEQIIRL